MLSLSVCVRVRVCVCVQMLTRVEWIITTAHNDVYNLLINLIKLIVLFGLPTTRL